MCLFFCVCICGDVQDKSVFEIAVELNRLQSLGVDGQLPPADTADGTFSLSNIGAIRGTYATPMLLPPSVAIGAFGRVQVENNTHMSHVSVPLYLKLLIKATFEVFSATILISGGLIG